MSNTTSSSTNGGIGLFGLLGIIFILLKLFEVTAVAGWSWWWVTAPLWLPAAVVVFVFIVIGLFWLVGELINNRRATRR